MKLDLAAVGREAAARWRQDRALLLPLAGLLLFVPQWAVLLLVPDLPQGVANPADTVAMTAWAEAAQRWAAAWGPLYLGAMVVAQWGQLAIMALYVGGPPTGAGIGEARPTVGDALLRALQLLLRYLLVEMVLAAPLVAAVVASAAAPPLLIVLVPAALYLVGRMLLVGPAILARQRTGAVAAVALSWRWSRGNGAPLALLAGLLMVGVPIVVEAVRQAGDGLRAAHLGNPVVLAAMDAAAAAIAAGAMLALSMCAGVLYRRLAR